MRIGIDFHIETGIYQGTRVYLNELVTALARIDHENRYCLFNAGYYGGVSLPEARNFTRQKMQTNKGEFNLLIGFSQIARKHRIDVFQTNYFKPLFLPCKSVIVIHDILQEVMPRYFPPRLRVFQKTLLPHMARQADAVITVSEFTRDQLLVRYRLNPEKVFVTPEAAAPVFRRLNSDASAVLRQYGIQGEYILYVGRLAPIKNIPGMLQAFAMVHRRMGGALKFVLLGQRDPLFSETEINGLIDRLKIAEGVVRLSSVPTEDLVAIYNHASVFLFMSHGEGFGLPILEAMACGTPVITSNTTACNETAGNAAMKISPDHAADIAEALIMVLENSGIQQDLSEKGLRRSRHFTWEACARKTLNVYEHVSD